MAAKSEGGRVKSETLARYLGVMHPFHSSLLFPSMPSHDASGARSFVDGGSEALYLALKDPANNMVLQVHTYFDSNNSGNAEIKPNTGNYFPDKINGAPATATQIGEARLTAVTHWARAHGKQIFIGELALCQTALDGSDQTPQMTATWRNTIDYVNANADVIIGFAVWEYGPTRWLRMSKEN